MITAVLVDDELPVLELLARMIERTEQVQVIGKFTSSEQALKQIPALNPDVAFLDVSMPRINGIELATQLIEEADAPAIVFVTAYEKYAVHAFQLNAVHYLLKPVTAEAVGSAVKRIATKHPDEPQELKGESGLLFFGNSHLRVSDSNREFFSGKLEELLALLVLHREKGISKWVIMDLLWAESELEKSQQNLYTIVFRLKKLLKKFGIPAAVRSKGSVYTLALDGIYCDVVEFERLAAAEASAQTEAERMQCYERLVAIYEGDFLGERDYMWSISYRERCYQQYVRAVQELAAWYKRAGETDKRRGLQEKAKTLLIEDDFEPISDGQ